MTATEELRRMLDERGVEWWQSANTLGCIFTRWYSPLFGDEVCAMENGDGELELFSHLMTPEQAITATLGSGTIEKAAERIEVLSGLAREYLHRYGMLMSMSGEDVTDEVLAMESVINEVCGKKVVDE